MNRRAANALLGLADVSERTAKGARELAGMRDATLESCRFLVEELVEAVGELDAAMEPTTEVQEEEFDCAANRHEPQPITSATSREPLGYRCKNCGQRCEANGTLT